MSNVRRPQIPSVQRIKEADLRGILVAVRDRLEKISTCFEDLSLTVSLAKQSITLNSGNIEQITEDLEQLEGDVLSLSSSGNFIPAGLVTTYAGSSAPSGWLLCNGNAVNRVTYSALFNVIGETYGVGDGSTTFNLPDMTSRFTQGVGGTDALADVVGSNTTDLSHTHTVSNTEVQSGTGATVAADSPTGSALSATYDNRPEALVLNYIIKF